MAKRPSLSAALSSAAKPAQHRLANHPAEEKRGTVLIGGHYAPEVRRVLKLIEADTGRPLRALLGEAINDLAAKYGKPQPYDDAT